MLIMKFSSTVLTIFCIVLFVVFKSTSAQYDEKRCKCICPPPVNRSSTETKKVYVKPVPPIDCNCKHVVPGLPSDECAQNDFCLRCKCSYESRNTTTVKIVVVFIICLISLLLAYILALCGLELLVHKNADKGRCRLNHKSDDNIQLIETSGSDTMVNESMRTARGRATTSRASEQPEYLRSSSLASASSSTTRRREVCDEEEDFEPGPSEISTGSDAVAVLVPGNEPVRGIVKKARHQQQRWKVDVDLQRLRVYDQHSLLN